MNNKDDQEKLDAFSKGKRKAVSHNFRLQVKRNIASLQMIASFTDVRRHYCLLLRLITLVTNTLRTFLTYFLQVKGAVALGKKIVKSVDDGKVQILSVFQNSLQK